MALIDENGRSIATPEISYRYLGAGESEESCRTTEDRKALVRCGSPALMLQLSGDESVVTVTKRGEAVNADTRVLRNHVAVIQQVINGNKCS
jgi:hypothetical protein